ncbi:hypothetical protein PILCRDRAFT_2458 [Piloderma croceum F 1598]|uniref:Uncharacterized protein n=1 Tax=Piloderma croceum (strain F 1598) TaxID=765440 RepID=A0A0C3FYB3_PILCF|nr:hypothetical protein PILCRDRAFT_2458 [Piloderma croceum F 1598]
MACERFLPVVSGGAKSAVNPLPDLGLSNNIIIQKLHFFISSTFPEPCISALKHIPYPHELVGKYHDYFSITIHDRIAEALAMEAVQDQSDKLRDMLHFLVIVNIIHELAHIVCLVLHETHFQTVNIYDYPYTIGIGTDQLILTFPEAGFTAEQEVFGGVIGVIFEDEKDGDQPPFFKIQYDRISHFFLQCEDGMTYCLGEFL